jgi:lipid II:glycine glycyltransferase (peptidoglycan interpeptide bridge formation enzyme)
MPDIKSIEKFIQTNSPDGGFLQSEEWRKLQELVGRKTFTISGNNFHANIIEHKLPIVGKYFYIPRGPVFCHPELDSGSNKKLDSSSEAEMTKIMELAKKNNAGWVRFDPINSQISDIIRENSRVIIKAPHDMQPRELFIFDITKPEAELLAEMKSKTRYNIKLALKHKVLVRVISNDKFLISNKIPNSKTQNLNFYLEEFLRLVKITAKRDKITPHPDTYYSKMFETIPERNLKLYLAEFEGKIIAANIIVFYGKVATYLHGASDNEYRNVMAPYLLQWQAMLDAKEARCDKYDMGGVKTAANSGRWAGITRFKTGFSTNTEPTKFLGSYDIIIDPLKHNLYRILQRIKALF